MRAAAPGPRTGDAAPAPSECLSEARYRLPRHAAVSFGSSDISGLFFASTVSPVADGGALVQRPRGRWFPKEGRPGARADSAPGESFSVAHCRLLHHTAVSFVSSDVSVFSVTHTPPPSLTTRPGGVSDADATSALHRPLAITYASRRMNRNRRSPDAHEDVNTELSGLPHVRAGVVME